MSSSRTPNTLSLPLPNNEYTLGWICTLEVEHEAACYMLDRIHGYSPHERAPHDDTSYVLGEIITDGCSGRISTFNVVIARLPSGQYGTNAAAVVGTSMQNTFRNIKMGFMVGVGGGIPPVVGLGDVVVGMPQTGNAGVFQYDLGKAETTGFISTALLHRPPEAFQTAALSLRSEYQAIRSLNSSIAKYLRQTKTNTAKGPQTPSHRLHNPPVERPDGTHELPTIHHGVVASGNTVIKTRQARDALLLRCPGIKCVEMEAAGLVNHFPCLNVRGVGNLADECKNDEWFRYAAFAAAAYVKLLLDYVFVHVDIPSTSIPPSLTGSTRLDVAGSTSSVRKASARTGLSLLWDVEDNMLFSRSPLKLTSGRRGSFN